MGKRIDRAVLAAVVAAGYYLLFLNAWGSIPLAWALAFVCAALTRYAARGLRRPARASRAQARAELLRLAALPDDEAEAALAALVKARYPGEAFRLAAVLKHPEATVSSGDVLNAWKANRDAGRLVIAATCPAEPRAALYARQLSEPQVVVVDSRILVKLLRAPGAPVCQAPSPGLKQRLREALDRLRFARISPRSALVAAALLGAYLLRGDGISLFAALAILGRLGVALIQRRAGRGLFE